MQWIWSKNVFYSSFHARFTFIVNPAKIDSPDETKSHSEIGSKYFKGIAAGTIMIGEHAKNEEFRKFFIGRIP